MSDHGRWIWYELITPDMAGAKRFYGDLLGWTVQDMPPTENAEPYSVLSAGGFGPNDATIKVRPKAARTTLIRPRTSFVPEMLKSVENI